MAARQPTFEIVKDTVRRARSWEPQGSSPRYSRAPARWHWRVRAGNGRILCHSEELNSRAACLRAIKACMAARKVVER